MIVEPPKGGEQNPGYRSLWCSKVLSARTSVNADAMFAIGAVEDGLPEQLADGRSHGFEPHRHSNKMDDTCPRTFHM